MINITKNSNGAIVLAAGQSRRMGNPKLLMSWNGTTIIQHILNQLKTAHIQPIVMVFGGNSPEFKFISVENKLVLANNPNFADGSMLHSVQIGIRELLKFPIKGIFIVLGDQPALQVSLIFQLIEKFNKSNKKIVVPEYGGHKGHPWLLSSDLAKEILILDEPNTLRTFLNDHKSEIEYIAVSDPSILSDIDTPEDYKQQTKDYRG
jgi:molybdenum cofactor cytidylyltransferase